MTRMEPSTGSTCTKHVKHVLARAFACSMLLVLPSCGIPGLRQAKPGAALPARFNLRHPDSGSELPEVFPEEVTEGKSSENSSRVKVEDFFQDPVLSRLINQALIGNFDLKILAEDIQIANNEVLGRSGAYLPFVYLGFTAGLERFSDFTPLGVAEKQLEYLPGKHFPSWPSNFIAAANISWQVDIWRQLRNARDAANLRFFATSEGRNYVVTRLVAEIAENYYTLMAIDKRLENLDDIIRLQEQSLKFAQAAKEAARGTELAVQRFQAEVRKNQSEKLIVTQDIIQVENRINFLLGRYPAACRTQVRGLHRSEHAHAEHRSARAATSEPTRHPPSRARAGGCRARREGRPGQLLS